MIINFIKVYSAVKLTPNLTVKFSVHRSANIVLKRHSTHEQQNHWYHLPCIRFVNHLYELRILTQFSFLQMPFSSWILITRNTRFSCNKAIFKAEGKMITISLS